MARSRYSKSKKGKSRRGKKSRHSKHSRHTKRNSGCRPHHTRRRGRGHGRGHRGGGTNHVCTGGGVQQPSGGYMSYNNGLWTSRNPACGSA